MFKRTITIMLIPLCAVFFFEVAYTEDINMDIDVVVAVAASAVKVSDLNFGTLFVDPGGDNFVLDASSHSTADGTGTLATADAMSDTGGTIVNVAGESGLIDLITAAPNVTVTITAPDTTLNPVGPSPDTITVQNIANNSTGGGGGILFAAAGDYELHIGGDLVITSGLTADTYQGTVVINIAYN